MIKKYRDEYNAQFSAEKYSAVQDKIEEKSGVMPAFRLSESPVFLSEDFKEKLLNASGRIVDQIKKIPEDLLQKAVPQECFVPNDTSQPHFFTIDFAICKAKNGDIEPRLIELQAFPSLYAFQNMYEKTLCEIYPFLNTVRNPIDDALYQKYLREVIVGNEDPKHVILLEIFPEKQKTAVDFALTEKLLAIKTVCLTKIIKEGKLLYYEHGGEKILIKRIYNRVILDELDRMPDLKTEFHFKDEVDVTWVTHPNWFYKISKYLLPMLSHPYVPKSYFLPDFPSDEKLENFVLKPLYSFAGSGVDLHPTPEKLAEIHNPEHYILQAKVQYEPIFEDINGEFSMAEIRLLYLWKENEARPFFVQNLARMTKAAMVNVDFNKKYDIWIGSSHAFFTP